MKIISIFAMVVLFAVVGLSSCSEDNGNVWSDEDVVTRSVNEVSDNYSMLDNGLFNLGYPKDWKCDFEYDEEVGMEEIRLRGAGIYIDIAILPFNLLFEGKMEEIMLEAADRGVNPKKRSVTIDGLDGVLYSGGDDDGVESIYFFRNGNKTIGFEIKKITGCDSDFELERSLSWKAGSAQHSTWLDDAKDMANAMTKIQQSDGYNNAFVKVVPEESLFIVRSERYVGYKSREEVIEKLSQMVNILQPVRDCAEHHYTFQLEGVDSEGNILFTHVFTPEDYRIDGEVVILR